MIAEIITVGDELLIGQVVDTNSAWIGKTLSAAGISVIQINSISDKAAEIVATLDKSLTRSQLVLMTGGLGPTRDDITKETLASYFNSPLVENAAALENVRQIFNRLNRPLIEVNRKQADVPENCIVLQNHSGTAPGMWFERDGQIVVSMPGVPSEMKGMMETQVIPMLLEKFTLPAIIHYTVLTSGIGESFLSELLVTLEDELPGNITLAYLPSLGTVRLRLTGRGADKEQLTGEIQLQVEKLRRLAGKYIVVEEDITLHAAILRKLSARKETLSLAESCTGGYMSQLFTSVAGASAVFLAGIVSYSNAAKISFLGVNPETIESFGAVSEQVAREMIQGLMLRTGSDYGISVTGIAGPEGGTPDKPVGTVWIGIGNRQGIYTRKFQFGNQRVQNIERSSNNALSWLNSLIGNPEDFKA